MSYYYNYYLGFEKDGKIFPLGLYDHKGKLHAVFFRSRSFASDLHEDFIPVPDGMISDELRKEFEYEDWNGEIRMSPVKYLELSALGSDDFIKRGYCLKSNIDYYLEPERDDWSAIEMLKDNMLTDFQFAMKAADELQYGIPKPEVDCEGEEIEVYPCSSYRYFSFPDYFSREYEVAMLKIAASAYEWDSAFWSSNNERARIVILEDEG